MLTRLRANAQKVLKIYTDGSYSSKTKKAGYAFVYLHDYSIYAVHGSMTEGLIKCGFDGGKVYKKTNQMAELTAVAVSLNSMRNYLKEGKKHNLEETFEQIHVYTDSMYIVNTYAEWIHNWEKAGWKKSNGKPVQNIETIRFIWDCYKDIEEMGQFVQFRHVKAHNGDPLNELADKYARSHTL